MIHWHDPQNSDRPAWRRPNNRPDMPACDTPDCQPAYPPPKPIAPINTPCPSCAEPLTPRTRKSDGKPFLGCTAFPDCTYTAPMPQDAMMRQAGADTLPGFD